MSTWSVLERHFDGLTPEEVDAELAAVPVAGASPISAASAAYLAEHGGPDLDGNAEPSGIHQRRTLTAARTLSETRRSALTLDEAATLLGVSRSRVSHRLADRSLWSFSVQGRRYVPRWQFTPEGQVIPGLPKVASAIGASLHPLAVESFMTASRADFNDRSPVDWLVSGGDPTVIAEWLIAIVHG